MSKAQCKSNECSDYKEELLCLLFLASSLHVSGFLSHGRFQLKEAPRLHFNTEVGGQNSPRVIYFSLPLLLLEDLVFETASKNQHHSRMRIQINKGCAQ